MTLLEALAPWHHPIRRSPQHKTSQVIPALYDSSPLLRHSSPRIPTLRTPSRSSSSRTVAPYTFSPASSGNPIVQLNAAKHAKLVNADSRTYDHPSTSQRSTSPSELTPSTIAPPQNVHGLRRRNIHVNRNGERQVQRAAGNSNAFWGWFRPCRPYVARHAA